MTNIEKIQKLLCGRKKGLSMAEIAERVGVSKPTVHRILEKLVSKGVPVVFTDPPTHRAGCPIMYFRILSHEEQNSK